MARLRRSMMFVPGNNPGMLINAGIYGADSIIFCVEDAVSIAEKDAARQLVANAIRHIKYSCEVVVRINHIQSPYGREDLDTILPSKPDMIRLPKAETAADIREVDEIITAAENKCGFVPGSIRMMAAIETCKGMMNAYEIASASPRMEALALGGEDFLADLRTTRTQHGAEFHVARSQIVVAARAAGIQAIDTVFSDINNEEGFRNEIIRIKELGFDGKSVINPRQIKIVHELFAPTQKEIDHAKRVVKAYKEAMAKGSGVISLNGKMIDEPVVARAKRALAYADALGLGKRVKS